MRSMIEDETLALQATCWGSGGGHTTTRRTQGTIIINRQHHWHHEVCHHFDLGFINRVALCTSARPADQAIAPLFPLTQKVSINVTIIIKIILITMMMIRSNDGANGPAIRQQVGPMAGQHPWQLRRRRHNFGELTNIHLITIWRDKKYLKNHIFGRYRRPQKFTILVSDYQPCIHNDLEALQNSSSKYPLKINILPPSKSQLPSGERFGSWIALIGWRFGLAFPTYSASQLSW